jgi:hypothetical protein
MSHCKFLGSYSVTELAAQLNAHPELWDEHPMRTGWKDGPFTETSDLGRSAFPGVLSGVVSIAGVASDSFQHNVADARHVAWWCSDRAHSAAQEHSAAY